MHAVLAFLFALASGAASGIAGKLLTPPPVPPLKVPALARAAVGEVCKSMYLAGVADCFPVGMLAGIALTLLVLWIGRSWSRFLGTLGGGLARLLDRIAPLPPRP